MLAKLIDLDALSRMMFLDLVYADQSDSDLFHRVLKSEEPELLAQFLALCPGPYRLKLENWLASASELSPAGLIAANATLDRHFDLTDQRKRQVEKNTVEAQRQTRELRGVMKAGFGILDNVLTDQEKGMASPPLGPALDPAASRIALPAPSRDVLVKNNIFDCIQERKSRRKFTDAALSQPELSWLLWATQGIVKTFEHQRHALRTVPSGGARHPFETFLALQAVEGIESGLYRYLPYSHELLRVAGDGSGEADLKSRLIEGCNGQPFAGECAAAFIWTAIPYRTEWRYLTEAKKIILQDSGHLCQNLYLACEAIGCGTCAIGAYDQARMDRLVGVDGEDEFVVYVAPVGRVSQ